VRIVRVRIGSLRLGSLKSREWRFLSAEEVEELKNPEKAKPPQAKGRVNKRRTYK